MIKTTLAFSDLTPAYDCFPGMFESKSAVSTDCVLTKFVHRIIKQLAKGGFYGLIVPPIANFYCYNCCPSLITVLTIKDKSVQSTKEETRSENYARHDERVAEYWEEVCAYIRQRFGAGPPDPDDVVQTAFVKILTNYDLTTIKNARAFLYTTAYNTAIDMIRSQKRLKQFKTTNKNDGWARLDIDDLTPDRILLSEENFQIALDTINDMPDVERETLILYRIHGLTLMEVAGRLGKSKTSIIRYLANAMNRLVEAKRSFENVQ